MMSWMIYHMNMMDRMNMTGRTNMMDRSMNWLN
jgi:hypothetical protein